MTVGELLSRISSHELSEWMAYAQIEPFGGITDYLGSAIVATTIANVNRGKGRRAYELKDFIPKFRKEAPSIEGMLQFAEVMTMGLGGKDLRKKDE